MFKKCITLITLTAFIIFTFACSSTKYLGLDSVSEFEGQKINITRIVKTTGEEIQFSNASDRITENSIVGEAFIGKEMATDDIQTIKQATGADKNEEYYIITKNGYRYDIGFYQELNNEVVLVGLPEELSIPLSEVRTIEFTKDNYSKGARLGGSIGCAVGVIAGILVHKATYQCDKTRYDCDLEGLHGGICVGAGSGICGLLGLGIGIGVTHNQKYSLNLQPDSISDITKEEDKIEIRKIITILSDRLGETIDLQERNKYNLFSNIQGFQSAVLLQLPDGRYVFEITTLDETTGEEKIEQMIQTESQIERIRDYIEQFE